MEALAQTIFDLATWWFEMLKGLVAHRVLRRRKVSSRAEVSLMWLRVRRASRKQLANEEHINTAFVCDTGCPAVGEASRLRKTRQMVMFECKV